MDTIKVVCGIILKSDTVFICRRNIDKSLGGYWEFPGGKIEVDERPEDSLRRELIEELGMTVNNLEYFKTVIHVYEKFTIELSAYTCKFQEASYNMTDHDKYVWLAIEELNNYSLAPADIPIAMALIQNV